MEVREKEREGESKEEKTEREPGIKEEGFKGRGDREIKNRYMRKHIISSFKKKNTIQNFNRKLVGESSI